MGWINYDAYTSSMISERYGINIMIEVWHDRIYSGS